ncbi:MAG: tetratricopeptide (TPR) repeat protein [Algoriphagus sp.]|jgi:tetratricopeptide (TPR) repeat protein
MAKKNSENTGIEILESAEALQQEINKAESFFSSNKNLLSIVGGIIIAAALGIIGYNYWIKQQTVETQTAMFDSVYYFESDSLDLALNGTGGNAGLIEVAENYSYTAAGNLANYYVGVAYMKKGEFQNAINYLSKFSSNDLILQGKAYALLGDANMELGQTAEAISFYEKAADYKPNKYMTPNYLMKLGTAYEVAGDKQRAVDAFSEIVEDYPSSANILAASKSKAKLETEAGK